MPPSIERAVAEQLPVTIAPATAPLVTPNTTHLPDRPPADDATTSTTTLPLSPIAAALPQRLSATAGEDPAPQPVLLGVPDIDLMVPVTAIGFEPDGQLEIPDETSAGWYRFGAAPGQPGATVIAAHVSWNDTIGPFFRLGELEPGALIQVDLADGGSRQYSVVERAQYPKLMLPRERIWTREGDDTLVLITCGGDFNRSIRRYTDNVVVYAVPVAAT